MGFSVAGFLIALAILIPNLLVWLFPPEKVPEGLKDSGFIFTLLERTGQIGCLLLLCISKDSFSPLTVNPPFVLMVLCILAYYSLWTRYVVKGRRFSLLFEPFKFIPIPMAVLPVLAFAFAAMLGESLWLGAAVVFLAAGHFANSWHTYTLVRSAAGNTKT